MSCDILNIKKGDVICEFSGYQLGIRTIALEDGHIDTEGYKVCKCELTNTKEVVTFSVKPGWEHYGPELYRDEIPYMGVKIINEAT